MAALIGALIALAIGGYTAVSSYSGAFEKKPAGIGVHGTPSPPPESVPIRMNPCLSNFPLTMCSGNSIHRMEESQKLPEPDVLVPGTVEGPNGSQFLQNKDGEKPVRQPASEEGAGE